jgi:hypothetical protein
MGEQAKASEARSDSLALAYVWREAGNFTP